MMDNLIYRQAALDMVNHLTEIYVNNLPPMLNKADVYDNLRLLPSADVPHWIPCSERLPIIDNNNRARVLITTSWGFVKEAYYCVDHWEINDIDYILTSVIAWMPLPDPYKDGEQNG